jgi:2-polyprenyl-6-methoxyphenol hydroxylase-like FAD-dependent oxidoreductase
MKITIIGAGIAGLTAAIAFRNAGYETTIYEAVATLGPVGAGLGLAPNAIKALDHLGIANDIIQQGRKLPYFRILDRTGKTISSNDSHAISARFRLDNLSIHRHDLHRILLKYIDSASIVTDKKAIGLEKRYGKHLVHFADGSSCETDYLVVADGINSALRNILAPDASKRYAGYLLARRGRRPGCDCRRGN